MLTLRRHAERRHIKNGKRDSWLSFQPTENFGLLTALNEILVPPGGVSAPFPGEEAEMLSYTHKGALAQEDSTGNSGVVHAGEFQHISVGCRIRHKETNPSRSDWAHVFRIHLPPSEVGLDCAREQKHFPAALRHNVLCAVASPDGRKGSLRLFQDARIYSSLLDPGHHLVHELMPGRSAWLHVILGEVDLQDIVLTQGDGVGITAEPSVSMTAVEDTEVLLVDLGPSALDLFNGEIQCS
jgi:hypothetical protein